MRAEKQNATFQSRERKKIERETYTVEYRGLSNAKFALGEQPHSRDTKRPTSKTAFTADARQNPLHVLRKSKHVFAQACAFAENAALCILMCNKK
jgi:hypothetical protein